MLPLVTVPPCLFEVLQACRGAFGGPGFATFVALVVGALGAVGPRTVTGMWVAAGLADRIHWSRAHRFFSDMKWEPDTVGLMLAHLVLTLFVAAGVPIVVAVDDTLFHRFGKLVYGAAWQHDGSAKGRDGIGRGNCFVVVGLVVAVPFMARSVLLPVLLPVVRAQAGPVEGRPGPRDGQPAVAGVRPTVYPRGRRRVVPGPGLAGAARRGHVHHPPVGPGGALRSGPGTDRQAGASFYGRAHGWAPLVRSPRPCPGARRR